MSKICWKLSPIVSATVLWILSIKLGSDIFSLMVSIRSLAFIPFPVSTVNVDPIMINVSLISCSCDKLNLCILSLLLVLFDFYFINSIIESHNDHFYLDANF